MKRLALILIIGSLILVPISPRPAHAQLTGVVCITPANDNNCPQTPFTFGNVAKTTPPSNFTVGVFVNNSDPMSSFDIYVQVDNAILNPAKVVLGNLIASPSGTTICIDGATVTGTCTPGTANGPGVVEVATSDASGNNECLSIPPCSGMAFNITYDVVGTGSTQISYPSSGGCFPSSVGGTSTCVLVLDNLGNVQAETVEIADFTNVAPAANFAVSQKFGLAPLTVNFDGSLSVATPGRTVIQYNWAFGDGSPPQNITTGPTTSHIYATAGNYQPTLEVVDSTPLKSSVKDGLTITVVAPDFGISAMPSSLAILRGTNKNSTITLSSLNTFSGTVVLTAQVSPLVVNGPTAVTNRTTVIVSSGKTNASRLTVSSTTTTPIGSYSVNVTGVSGALRHSVIVSVTVTAPDFSLSSSPSSLSVPQGGNGLSNVTLTSLSSFNGTVSLSASTTLSSSVLGFPTPSSVKLTAAGKTNTSSLYVIVQSGTAPGTYTIKVIGTSGALSHNFNITITVPPPDFRASAAPTSLSVKGATNGTSIITFTGLNGFVGTISLSANSSATLGISSSLSPTSVTITASSGPVASTLTISTLATSPPGTYAINITSTSNGIFRYATVMLVVTSSLPSIQLVAASLSTLSVTAGKSVDMTVSVSNTGSLPVNVTVTMDVSVGGGINITVAQKMVILSAGEAAQIIILSWNTTQWSSGNYHIYARVIGAQTSSINQAASAGSVALNAPPPSPAAINLDVIPWITTAIAAAIAVVLSVMLLRRRPKESTIR